MIRLRGATHFFAAITVAMMLAGPALAQVENALFDFEAPGFDANSISALGDAGFDFFFSSTGGTDEFGDFSGFIPMAPALNVENPTIVTVAFSDDMDEEVSNALDGNQSLVFFADVFSPLFQDDPAVNADPRTLLLNVFQQQTITADDIGVSVDFTFLFSGAEGSVNTEPGTTVEAFLLTLDPNDNFNATNNLSFDLSGGVLGTTDSGLLELDLTDPALEGQILQFGVRNAFADGQNPAVIVDNLQLTVDDGSGGALDGDFNGDGVVSLADYATFRDGDSPNGAVSADFDLFVENFNTVGPALSAVAAPTAVPEPSGLLLLIAGTSAAAWRRR